MDTKPDAAAANDNTTDEETEVHDSLMFTPAQSSIPEADEGGLEQESYQYRTTHAGFASSQNTPVQVRTIPLNLNTAVGRSASPYRHHTSNSVGSTASPIRTSSPLRENTTGGSTGFGSPSRAFSSTAGYASGAGSFPGTAGDAAASNMSPQALRPMATGTRYGAALGGSRAAASPVKTHSTGSPRKWGGETPLCERCGKSVYFAEQVRWRCSKFDLHLLRDADKFFLISSSPFTSSFIPLLLVSIGPPVPIGQGGKQDLPQSMPALHGMWYLSRFEESERPRGCPLLREVLREGAFPISYSLSPSVFACLHERNHCSGRQTKRNE